MAESVHKIGEIQGGHDFVRISFKESQKGRHVHAKMTMYDCQGHALCPYCKKHIKTSKTHHNALCEKIAAHLQTCMRYTVSVVMSNSCQCEVCITDRQNPEQQIQNPPPPWWQVELDREQHERRVIQEEDRIIQSAHRVNEARRERRRRQQEYREQLDREEEEERNRILQSASTDPELTGQARNFAFQRE